MEDGSGLKLTVARYYTPKNRSIQERGIVPDVLVADAGPARAEDAQLGEKDLKRHLKNDGPAAGVAPAPAAVAAPHPGAAGEDYQLRTALDYLKAEDIFKASGEPPRGAATKKE
jgi:carboxyl-terminal processing protease